MLKEYAQIDERLLKVVLMGVMQHEILLNGTPAGFEVFIKQNGRLFKLYTQRKSPRVFRSPNAAISFLRGLGVERVTINGLGSWNSSSCL